jgi:hypothetical protein
MAKQTPLGVIKMKCMDCSATSKLEVRLCPVVSCPLHSWRFGKYPKKSSYFAKGKPQKPPIKPQDETKGESAPIENGETSSSKNSGVEE